MRDHPLPAIDLGHRDAAFGKPLADPRHDGFVLRHRDVKHAREGDARDVVFGGAKSARQHDDIGPLERAAQHRRQLRHVVSHDGLHADVVADGVEQFGDEERVGVDAEGSQHFAANSDDARAHNVTNCSADLQVRREGKPKGLHYMRASANIQTRSARFA